MKATQFRELSENELNQKLAEARKELFNLRFQMAAGQLENTHRLKTLKREIARVLTVKEELKLSPEEQELLNKKQPAVKSKSAKTLKAEKVSENEITKEAKKTTKEPRRRPTGYGEAKAEDK
jgi:large subunit ribosomal protein L29